ncbi:hypothetical protein LTR95_001278 [Oleoguttula sp. CCFEE 5521]
MAPIGSPPAWQYSPALQGYYYIDDRGGRRRTLVTADGRQYPVDGSVSRTVEEASSASPAAGSHTDVSRLDAPREYTVVPGPARAQYFQSGAAVRHNAHPERFASAPMRPTTPGIPRSQSAADRIPPRAMTYTPSPSQVKSTFQIAPPQALAKPRPHPRTDTVLDEDFRVRQRPREFFIPGKVFMVLWAEPARANSKKSDSGGDGAGSIVTEGNYRELVFSKVRRFVVIRAGERSCSALPIITYTRHLSPASAASEQGVIYSDEQPHGEPHDLPGLLPRAVRVQLDSPSVRLESRTLIDYSEVHTVDHHLKVKSLGQVDEHSAEALLQQFRDVFIANIALSGSLIPRPHQGAAPRPV